MWSAFTTCVWLFVFAQAIGVAARYAASSSPPHPSSSIVCSSGRQCQRGTCWHHRCGYGQYHSVCQPVMHHELHSMEQSIFRYPQGWCNIVSGSTRHRVSRFMATIHPVYHGRLQSSSTLPLAIPEWYFVTVNNNSTAFSVSYSDGTSTLCFAVLLLFINLFVAAEGFVAKETVQLANLTVSNQVLGSSKLLWKRRIYLGHE